MTNIDMDIHELAFSGNLRALTRALDEDHKLVCARNKYEETALHRAAMNGWQDCVDVLLTKGSDVNAGDVTGCTPLHYAAANGYVGIARQLITKGHASVTQKSNKGQTARHMAKCRQQIHVIAFFNEVENNMSTSGWF